MIGGARLPSTYEIVDAELHGILMALRTTPHFIGPLACLFREIMALSREIYAVEEQYTEADEQYTELSRKLRHVTQERLNTEEELLASNVRLKQLLGELQAARDAAHAQSSAVVQDNKMTMGELTRKVESTLMTVLDERFRDEAFTSAITEQSVLSTDKVRVEFEGDEVFWSLQDNYSFEMLLGDASRYWDVAPQDAILFEFVRNLGASPALE